MFSQPLMIVLAVVGVAAFVFALVSLFQAWRIAGPDPRFQALGLRKWVMGSAVMAYMPEAAMPYVKRYFLSFLGFFFVCLTIIAIAWLGAAQET